MIPNKNIPIVESMPVMIPCNRQDTGHYTIVKECQVCADIKIEKTNKELQFINHFRLTENEENLALEFAPHPFLNR